MRPLMQTLGQPEHAATTAPRRLRVLAFTSLYPSVARPRHGIFVEARLGQLVRDFAVDARVIAPVPWFPFSSPRFGAYARFAATPRQAIRDNGLAVSYPRYLMLPKVGVSFQPGSMACAALGDFRRLQHAGWRPDLIDAHYLYPDGVAAALLAHRLRLPFVMTARGTDVNVLAKAPGPGRKIMAAAAQAKAVITVSTQLKDTLVSLGVAAAKIVVLRNGVDLDVFGLEDQAASRARLALPTTGGLVACVGNLVAEKNQALAIAALQHLQDFRLVIVGDGPLHGELAKAAADFGVGDRVIFRSAMPQRELRHLYASADVLLLTSKREGWPNVVLESLACGTPVVAVDVGAVHDMLTDDRVGRIVAQANPAALATAVKDLCATPLRRDLVRLHASRFDWASVSRGQWDVFVKATSAAAAGASGETEVSA
jgi:glycosyltransferase involved in cell wall biosynthesis